MHRHSAAIALALMLPLAAFAQNQPGKQPPVTRISKPSSSKAAPGSKPADSPQQPKSTAESVTLAPGMVELSEDVFRLDAAGLAMHLPVGAIAQVSAAASEASAKITPPKGDQTWIIEIQTKRTRDLNQKPESVCRGILQQLLASVGVVDRSKTDRDGNVIEKLVSTKGTVVEPVKNVILKAERPEFERPAARFYVKLPRGEHEESLIRGITVFQTGPGEFVLFDLKTLEPDLAKARPLYEGTLASARFSDVTMVLTNRGAAVETGADFIGKLTDADYDAAIDLLKDQWFRLARPDAGGGDNNAQEIAYRRIRAKRGARGEIDPSSHAEKWSQEEREQGIIVRIDARYLQDTTVIDWVGIYWVSKDFKQEAWSLQQAIREPGKKAPTVVTETGAREGDQMGVSLSGNAQETRRIKPDVPKVGYISQAQSFLLPTLLVLKQTPGQYGFYVYQSQTETGSITLRRDSLKSEEGLERTWTLTTQQVEDRPAQVSTYKDSGVLIQTIFAAEKMNWTPTTLQRLAELWKQKNLPMN
jgi:hypothetical protein